MGFSFFPFVNVLLDLCDIYPAALQLSKLRVCFGTFKIVYTLRGTSPALLYRYNRLDAEVLINKRFTSIDNAELCSKVGVPFVMGTTGGDREKLHKTVADSKVYAVISPQMGKQVVAFLAAMEIMAEQFPGSFSGYSLQVMESHQASKLDTSGTVKAVISCFQKLGVSFDLDEVQLIRDPVQQVEMVGVPEEYLLGHAFHMYHLTSPDRTVSLEFQHNVCGRSIYAEGTVDAILFLAKKVKLKAEKRIYNMIDVLREGNMR
ncbi:4-hydroxy-tetrahydrodipicolinate reductase 1, chloroplastic-like [Lycium ferocissimum]|uniref:4-hydroxy-tetrahydrodipicolinate reductase 1, chloroplastic-like n=1 Tax=Lycium ferocissimum TaxID=112874 RepID=UPI002815162E|nr:4-hydroxy-tetrahydrodipicolinate reductase 1, chloroplastic-like [Lycium ferocissimum]